MTIPRIITALFFVPFTIAAVWYGSLPFFLYVMAIGILGFWEFSAMAEQGGYPNQRILGLAGTLLVILAIFFDGLPTWGPVRKSPSALLVLVAWLFISYFFEFFKRDKGHSLLRIMTTTMGIFLCAFLIGHLLLLRDLRVATGEGFRLIGREVTFFLIAVIWTVDTGAWVFGKLMGRFPMAPVISPKKTWVGAVGGTVSALAVGWLYREAFLKTDFTRRDALVYSLMIAVLAQSSDLMESMIKRTFGVKNSSEILPGHGGILDRFDSFIFSAPIFYYVLLVTGRFQ